jgi:putative redox protein
MSTVHHIARATASSRADAPTWQVDLRSGRHRMLADEPPTNGGGDAGPSPFGLVLGGLAACTVTTLRMYADRKGWPLASVDVDVRYDVDDDGRGAIDRTITLPAELPPDQRERLAEIAERTPVTLIVRTGVPIATTVT